MTLRNSLLMVEQNKRNNLLQVLDDLYRRRDSNMTHMQDMQEAMACLRDCEKRILELS